MNIAEYRQSKDDNTIYNAKISLKKDYYVVNADEYGYSFLGTNSAYPFIELIHPEDRTELLEAFEHLGESEQCLILRIKAYNDKYRYMYVTASYNGRVLNGFRSIDIKLTDIMRIRDGYSKYAENIEKYRSFMCLVDHKFYEYDYQTDMFQIYEYRGTKNIPIIKRRLSELVNEVNHNPQYDAQERGSFEILVSSIINGADLFGFRINGRVFGSQLAESGYEIKSTTIYRDDSKYLNVGVMRSTSRTRKEAVYYMTEAARDSGTGLLNKRAISEYTMERLNEGGKSLYLAIMDIDDFKKINDTYGHMFGDQVLSKVSEILRSVVTSRGNVGRFGGDEFFILFEGLSTEADLRRVLRTINKHIQWAYDGVVEGLTLTTSIGISKYPDDGTDYDVLFKKADKSLYIAKAKGKNRYIIYDEAKHGPVDMKQDGERIMGLSSILSSEKKVGMVSELILKLHEEGLSHIDEALAKVREYFDLDGIAIYKGPDWKRVYSSGKYIGAIQNYPLYEDAGYRERFDENGVLLENNVRAIVNTFPIAFKALDAQETSGMVQVLIEQEDNGVHSGALVSFDVFNRTHKRSGSDKNYLTIIGKILCELML